MTYQAIIDDILLTAYETGARGPASFDCWGVVIEVCARAGWPIPVDPITASSSPRELLMLFRDNYREEHWKLTSPVDGAVAFFGRLSAGRHAGIVINGGILHTREGVGPMWQPLSDFEGQNIEYALWVA